MILLDRYLRLVTSEICGKSEVELLLFLSLLAVVEIKFRIEGILSDCVIEWLLV